jgi:hypothetical protein
MKPRSIFVILMIAMLTQSCLRGVGSNTPSALPTVLAAVRVSTETRTAPSATPTLRVEIPTLTTPTVISPMPTSIPNITISAVKGNIFIRRGPDMAYNPIGVLYKDTNIRVIARDVLSNWAQVIIPDSDRKGWIYVKSEFTKVDGDLNSAPDFTPTDWPVPGYLVNCTHHDMYVMPGEITIPASFGYPANDVWLYPGFYTVQDISMPNYPKVQDVEMREGVDIEIHVDGTGEGRKCP